MLVNRFLANNKFGIVSCGQNTVFLLCVGVGKIESGELLLVKNRQILAFVDWLLIGVNKLERHKNDE